MSGKAWLGDRRAAQRLLGSEGRRQLASARQLPHSSRLLSKRRQAGQPFFDAACCCPPCYRRALGSGTACGVRGFAFCLQDNSSETRARVCCSAWAHGAQPNRGRGPQPGASPPRRLERPPSSLPLEALARSLGLLLAATLVLCCFADWQRAPDGTYARVKGPAAAHAPD
jgi:hypothetical protein